MSLATLDTNKDLSEACVHAYSEGILMLCCTHDEGSNVDKAYPACYESTITIAAVDNFGIELRQSKQDYKYGISGENVAAGVVPFLESDDRISGSSVSTAIAAGLSSLILSCDRLACPGRTYESNGRKSICEDHFDKMKVRQDAQEKYVLLEKFGSIDKKLKDGLDISVEEVLKESFASRT